MKSISIFWFRRDLRLEDNTALNKALAQNSNVLPLFIFDDQIVLDLPNDDARISFIYKNLQKIDGRLKEYGSSLLCLKGDPLHVWKELLKEHHIKNVYVNKDYEPYARQRDEQVEHLLKEHNVAFFSFKDQVIHEEHEVLKNDGTPYTVFTPYKNKWLSVYHPQKPSPLVAPQNLRQETERFPSIAEFGFTESKIIVRDYNLAIVEDYHEKRDFPDVDATSYLSPHLRFGTVSIRTIIKELNDRNKTFLSELIWREFFMQILFHFPDVVTHNFKRKYDGITWLNNDEHFAKWCQGKTGYPMVDAGMRQLNTSGYMHNRVRMITAGFLCKHLLIDWRWGEAYFAKKLLDFELASNNGNWQWAAGTGCDAAPYFRVFNPIEQLKKFDNKGVYVKKWIPELNTLDYPNPIVEHKFARKRALETYKIGIEA